MRRLIVPSCLVFFACASARLRIPDSLKGYDIVVSHRDTLSEALVRALRDGGFRVRRAVRGGGPPAAGLVYFTFQDTGPEPLPWLYVRLVDTRSGAVVAAAALRLDAVGPAAGTRARLVVDSLAAPLDSRLEP